MVPALYKQRRSLQSDSVFSAYNKLQNLLTVSLKLTKIFSCLHVLKNFATEQVHVKEILRFNQLITVSRSVAQQFHLFSVPLFFESGGLRPQ